MNGNGVVLVGEDGTGTFNISGGAKFTAASLTLGLDANSSGTLTVTGSGGTNDSTLSVTTTLTIGDSGTGKLTMENGATLTNAQLNVTVGGSIASNGNLKVDGLGSALHVAAIALGAGGGAMDKCKSRMGPR